MSSFSAQVRSLHAACIKQYGVPAVLHSQNYGDRQISGIIEDPVMADDYVPGSQDGVNVVRFFVDYSALSILVPPANPKIGDTITLNGVDYNVGSVDPDAEGGATLKLKKR